MKNFLRGKLLILWIIFVLSESVLCCRALPQDTEKEEIGYFCIFISDSIQHIIDNIAKVCEIIPSELEKKTPYLRVKVDWLPAERKQFLEDWLSKGKDYFSKDYIEELLELEESRDGYIPVGKTVVDKGRILKLCVVKDGTSGTFPSYYWLDKSLPYNNPSFGNGELYTIKLPIGEYRVSLYLTFRDRNYKGQNYLLDEINNLKVPILFAFGQGEEIELKNTLGRRRFYLFGKWLSERFIIESNEVCIISLGSKITEWWGRFTSDSLISGVDYE